MIVCGRGDPTEDFIANALRTVLCVIATVSNDVSSKEPG